MFWKHRLKAEAERTGWMVPYGDLMSLLLAIFVMIAAMSEVHSGERFSEISRSVRGSFGFRVAPQVRSGDPVEAGPTGLLARLEDAAMSTGRPVRAGTDAEDPLRMFEVTAGSDGLTLRVCDPDAFGSRTGVLSQRAETGLRYLSQVLGAGDAAIEIRGLAHLRGDEPSSGADDRWDMAWNRARGTARVLSEAGIGQERLSLRVQASEGVGLDACLGVDPGDGATDPRTSGEAGMIGGDYGRRATGVHVEIVVHGFRPSLGGRTNDRPGERDG